MLVFKFSRFPVLVYTGKDIVTMAIWFGLTKRIESLCRSLVFPAL